jgi:hypothetical protein
VASQEERERFWRDFETLTPEIKRAFARSLAQFIENAERFEIRCELSREALL